MVWLGAAEVGYQFVLWCSGFLVRVSVRRVQSRVGGFTGWQRAMRSGLGLPTAFLMT